MGIKRIGLAGRIHRGKISVAVDWKVWTKTKPCPVCGNLVRFVQGHEPDTCHREDCRWKYRAGFDKESWAVNRPQKGQVDITPEVGQKIAGSTGEAEPA